MLDICLHALSLERGAHSLQNPSRGRCADAMRFPTKRAGLLAATSLLATSVATPADVDSHAAPTAGGYAKHIFSPESAVRAGAGAAIDQANDTPHEWGQGAAGFGRRFGSAFGKHIVHKTIQYPVSRLLHEEFSYRRSDKTGFGARLKHAVVATVITHKTTTGKQTVAVGEISGAVGSGLISRLWQPASTGTVAAGFTSGGITLGVDAGMNVVREFWPEIRHPHRHAAACTERAPDESLSTDPESSTDAESREESE